MEVKIHKELKRLASAEVVPRLALAVFRPPGTGKTTFLKALRRVFMRYGVAVVYLSMKEVSDEIVMSERAVLSHIVEVMRPTISTILYRQLTVYRRQYYAACEKGKG